MSAVMLSTDRAWRELHEAALRLVHETQYDATAELRPMDMPPVPPQAKSAAETPRS